MQATSTPEKAKARVGFGALGRIGKLVKLQFGEKFKVIRTYNLRAFLISLFIKLALVAGITVLMSVLITRFIQLSMFQANENTLAVFLFIIVAISFVSSLVTVFRNLYNVKDNQFLFTMPVRPSEVFVSKLIITFLSEILSSVLFSLPFLICFAEITKTNMAGLFTGATVTYAFVSVFAVLVIPAIVLLLTTLLSIPLLLLKNLINKYSVLKIAVWAVSFVAVILLLNWILNIAIDNFSLMGQWLQLSSKLAIAFENFAKGSWIFLQLSLAFAGVNVGWVIFACLGVLVVLAVVTYFVIKPFYFKASLWEISKKREFNTQKEIKPCKHPFWTITRKNVWLLLQDPSTAISYFIPAIAMPFIVTLVDKFMNAMYLRDFGYRLLFGGNLAILVLCSLLCCTYAGSGVSQEGANYYLLKSGPVSYRMQAASKITINLVVNAFFLLASCIVATAITELVFWEGLYAFAVALIISLGQMLFVFSNDFVKPQIEWKDVGDFKKCKAIGFSMTAGVIVGLAFTAFIFKFLLIAPFERALVYLALIPVVYLVYALRKLHVNLICEA
ncbi:MAG: hypothetical protein NC132_02980 [Corallococcus sp.]|nr:hypothetical protein [Corallococcus sp.]MCM1359073.1 hypothetical protein [Corallococcus sp.]MCM1395062.1 hypothetical protein [Corallococcus sp.]